MTAGVAPLAHQVADRAEKDSRFARVLDALLTAPTCPQGALERIAARTLSDQRRTALVEDFVDGSIRTPQVQALLKLRTPQAVHRLRSRGKLIGRVVGNQTWFPAWQFDGDRMRPDLPRILELLTRFTSDPLAADRIMRLKHEELGDTSIAAALRKPKTEMERPIRAFTLTFENPLYDEASIAEAQARYVGATYHPIPITGREIADSFADAIWHAETQMFNGHGVAKYLLSRAVRAAGIKVVFTGEGADEMLGGYPYFRVDALNDNAALTAGEKSALLDEMLGANAATRALLMPEQVNSPEMQAVERRLGWLPATLNVGATQANKLPAPGNDLVVGWWWLWLEGLVPPPVGALAGGSGAGFHRGRGTVRRTRE